MEICRAGPLSDSCTSGWTSMAISMNGRAFYLFLALLVCMDACLREIIGLFMILAHHQAQNAFLAFQLSVCRFPAAIRNVIMVKEAKIVFPSAEAIVLRVQWCSHFGASWNLSSVEVMKDANLDHSYFRSGWLQRLSLDSDVWSHSPSFAAFEWYLLLCLFGRCNELEKLRKKERNQGKIWKPCALHALWYGIAGSISRFAYAEYQDNAYADICYCRGDDIGRSSVLLQVFRAWTSMEWVQEFTSLLLNWCLFLCVSFALYDTLDHWRIFALHLQLLLFLLQ